MDKKRQLAYLALILNSLIWGAALPIVKPALDYVTPYQYLFYRYLLAAVLSLPILVYLFYRYRPTLKLVVTIIAMELLGLTAALSLLYEGLSRTSALESSFLASTVPLFVVLGGLIFLKEKEERHEAIGLLLALAGAVIMTLAPLINGQSGLDKLSLMGNLLVLGHNLCWTVYLLLAKKVYAHTPKLLIGFLSLWVGLVSFAVLVRFTTPAVNLTQSLANLQIASVFWPVLYMGFLGSIIAWPAVLYGNHQIEASEAALFSYIQPLVYLPLATLWLKEAFTFPMIIASVLMAIGVVIAERRPAKKPQK